MAVAGNRGGAGGAKNIARAQRPHRPKPPSPPSFPKLVPSRPGAITPTPARRAAKLAPSLPKITGPPPPQPQRLRSVAQTQRASERKRAKRVELSAQRQRTGGEAPIIVRRRAKVARQEREAGAQQRALAQLKQAGEKGGILIKPPKPIKEPEKPRKAGGLLGTAIGATRLADKLLSGKTLAKPAAAAAGFSGKALESAVTGRYLKKPFKAIGLKWQEPIGPAKTVSKIARAGGRDIVDLPVNFIPSLYVPGKESAKSLPAVARGKLKEAGEHQYKAGKMLADPIIQTAEHPVKSFVEHPLETAAIFAGGEGAIGRAGGAALRKGVAGEAGRRVARTERAPRTIPGTPAEVSQPYSPDVLRKGVQVAGEKVAARRRKRKGAPPGRRMTGRDINREVDQDVRIGRNATTLRDERAAVDTAHTVNPPRHVGPLRVRRRLRNKPVSAAHTVAVQGLTNATKADVKRLLAETEQAAKKLGGEKLRQNQQRQHELKKALAQWKPETEAHVREVQQRLREQTAPEEEHLIKTGVLDASRADANRYAPAAVRHGLHDPETAAEHVKTAGQERGKAASQRRGAFRRRQSANAALREQTTKTRAAELGPRGNKTAGTDRAERELRGHEQTLRKVREQEATDLGAARRELDDARHAAELSTKEISPTPEVLITKAGLDTANRNLAEAVHAAAGRERISGRGEGRAQEKVAAHERAQRKAGKPTAAGTEPRAVLERVERRGASDLEHRQRVLRARAEVENAVAEHARAQARARGVPPKEADRLRKAIVAHDDARLKFADPDSLSHLRDNVEQATAKLAYERSKTGLRPDDAQRLWNAIHEAEDATKAHTEAIGAHERAVARHRELQDAPYISSKGVAHTVGDVRSHPAMSGQPEPSFMPHAYEAAHGAVPVDRVRAPNPQKRSGLMVAEGTSPVGRGHLTTARVSRARMISAAENRMTTIDKWGYREEGTPVTGPPTIYSTKGKADAAAAAAEHVTGHEMAAFADQATDGYVLVPKRVIDRLGEHEETVLHRDRWYQRLGRAWRTGVLSTSTRWLTGQGLEPAVRLAIEHNFNPVKLARSYRALSLTDKELRANDPEAFARFETLYKRGGVSRNVKVSRDEALTDFLMRDSAGGLEAAIRKMGQKPGLKQLGWLAGAWQRFWFHMLNGSIESLVRRGMVGRELIKDPIIRDRKLALNFSQASKDLAQGLRDSPAQNRFARGLDDAFGKYQGRSPKEQAAIENYTPFIPWFLSSMRFLYWVLPRDHPVLTALGASASQATEDWRRKYGIYYDPSTSSGMGVAGTEKNLPLTRQGSIPVGADALGITHYTPFAGPQGFGDMGSFLVPQLQDIQAASKGKDWRDYGLTGRDQPVNVDRIAKATLAATLTTLFPPAGVGAKLAGIHLPSEPDLPEGEKPPDFGERFGKQFNPLALKPGLQKGVVQKEQRRKAASKKAAAKRRKKPGPTPARPFAGQSRANPFAGQSGSNPFAGGG